MVEDDSEFKQPLDLPEDTTTHQHVPAPPKKKKGGSKKLLVIGLIVVIAACLGFVAWKLLGNKKSTTSNTASSATSETPQSAKTSEVPASTGTKTYTNDIMRLSFTYPNNWTVTEKEHAVWVESPEFSYQTVDKGVVTGNFRIYIRQGAQTSDSKYIAKGVAIAPSEKLVYAKPAAGQRKETLLSSFGIDTTDNFAFFLIAGNFNLKKGDTLGPNYGKEADTFIIGGGYSSKELTDGLATNKVAVDQYQQSTAYKQALEILKSIQIQ